MLEKAKVRLDRVLRFLRLKPLSLAEKSRLMFGGAVLLILSLALLIPYFWMGKLNQKNALDSGRAVAEVVFYNHFQLEKYSDKDLPLLNESGTQRTESQAPAKWIKMYQADVKWEEGLPKRELEAVKSLEADPDRVDMSWTTVHHTGADNYYVKVVRAAETCLLCHNPGDPGRAFNKNQTIGAIIVKAKAVDLTKTIIMNRVATVIAGLLAATAAVIAFYAISQRIILRPIRQLRALVNNVAEGNLDVRSAIKSGDEYEKLSDAFNHMLDGLQESQEKLRQANVQLDTKISQLSDRNIELFKANKLKSEFLANMSHEFRTPLNAILGFAQLVRERAADNPEKSQRYAENIISSGRNLLNMINDLLDLAKAEAGKMELHIDRVNIQDICQGLFTFFLPMIKEKNIEMRLSISEDIPVVQTDSGKVQQILYNLLSNAIKFTDDNGWIEISSVMLDDITVRISVADSGCGISEENLGKVFEKFRQLDGSITRQGTGTGLGLAICKELSELVAGTVSVESEFGRGTIFHLDIPIMLSEGEEVDEIG